MDFARGILDGGEFSFPDAEVEEVVGPDGKARRVVWTNSPRRGEEGEVTGVVRVGFDLERFDDPSKDEALRDSVLQELPVPAWRCNAQGEIDLVNSAWLTLRGRSLEEEFRGLPLFRHARIERLDLFEDVLVGRCRHLQMDCEHGEQKRVARGANQFMRRHEEARVRRRG